MTVLVKYQAARHALAVCKQVDEVKDIRDKAEAMRLYGQMSNDKTLEMDAAEIRIRAERRLGELIGAQKAGPGLNKGGNPEFPTGRQSRPVSPTLADVGISKDLSSRAQAIAAVPEAEFEAEVGEWRERVGAEGARVTTRLVKAGKKAAAKQPEPDHDNRLTEAIKLVDQLSAETFELQERIEALTVTDLAKKVDELVRANAHAVREKDMEMDKNAQLLKRANDAERFRSEVVKVSGAQNPKGAIQWVKAMAARKTA